MKSVTGVKAREGRYLGGPKPFGYDYGDEPGALVVNEDEAAVVRRIFRDFNAGTSQRQIARDLNAERIPHSGKRQRITATRIELDDFGRVGELGLLFLQVSEAVSSTGESRLRDGVF